MRPAQCLNCYSVMKIVRVRFATAASLYLVALTGISVMAILLDGSTQRTRSYAFDFLALGLTCLIPIAVLLGVSEVFSEIETADRLESLPEPARVIRLAA